MGRCLLEGLGKDSSRYEKGPITCDRGLFQGCNEVDPYHDVDRQSAFEGHSKTLLLLSRIQEDLPPCIFCSCCYVEIHHEHSVAAC